MALTGIFGSACDSSAAAASKAELPKPAMGLPSDKEAKPGDKREAIFAGGCFWCVEGVFEQLEGVYDAVSGYAGGTKDTADYKTVCTGTTGHAEAVKVIYDPTKITYADLLHVFFATHDPTTLNRQGHDAGTQYRSAIFYENEEQKKVAEAYVKQLNDAKIFPSPIVTAFESLKPEAFYVAEDYHQNYVACNLNNPYVRGVALPKVKKVRDTFKDQLKKSDASPEKK